MSATEEIQPAPQVRKPISAIIRDNIKNAVQSAAPDKYTGKEWQFFEQNSVSYKKNHPLIKNKLPLRAIKDFISGIGEDIPPYNFIMNLHKFNTALEPADRIKLDDIFKLPPSVIPLEIDLVDGFFDGELRVLSISYDEPRVEHFKKIPRGILNYCGSYVEHIDFKNLVERSSFEEIYGRIKYYESDIKVHPEEENEMHAFVDKISWDKNVFYVHTGSYALIRAIRNSKNINGKKVHQELEHIYKNEERDAIDLAEIRTDGNVKPHYKIKLENHDFNETGKIRDLQAGGLLLSSSNPGIIMQERSNKVSQLPNRWHYFGGNFVGGTGNEADISLRKTAIREISQEIEKKTGIARDGLRTEKIENCPVLVINETKLDNIQVSFLGMRTQENDNEIKGNWEGTVSTFNYRDLTDIFKNQNSALTTCSWVPSGLCQLLIWLLLGAPGANEDFKSQSLKLFMNFFKRVNIGNNPYFETFIQFENEKNR